MNRMCWLAVGAQHLAIGLEIDKKLAAMTLSPDNLHGIFQEYNTPVNCGANSSDLLFIRAAESIPTIEFWLTI